MDIIETRTRSTVPSPAIVAEPPVTADGLAKRFFVLTMIGIVVYISAIMFLMSMSSGSN